VPSSAPTAVASLGTSDFDCSRGPWTAGPREGSASPEPSGSHVHVWHASGLRTSGSVSSIAHSSQYASGGRSHRTKASARPRTVVSRHAQRNGQQPHYRLHHVRRTPLHGLHAINQHAMHQRQPLPGFMCALRSSKLSVPAAILTPTNKSPPQATTHQLPSQAQTDASAALDGAQSPSNRVQFKSISRRVESSRAALDGARLPSTPVDPRLDAEHRRLRKTHAAAVDASSFEARRPGLASGPSGPSMMSRDFLRPDFIASAPGVMPALSCTTGVARNSLTRKPPFPRSPSKPPHAEARGLRCSWC